MKRLVALLLVPFLTLAMLPGTATAAGELARVPVPAIEQGNNTSYVTSVKVLFNTNVALVWHLPAMTGGSLYTAANALQMAQWQQLSGIDPHGFGSIGDTTWASIDRGEAVDCTFSPCGVFVHALRTLDTGVVDPSVMSFCALFNTWYVARYGGTPCQYGTTYTLADKWLAAAWQGKVFPGGGNGANGPQSWGMELAGITQPF